MNKDNVVIKSNIQGECPCCGEQGTLDYGAVSFEGEMCYFPYKCLNCGAVGEEWYNMSFAGHNLELENGTLEVEQIVDYQENKKENN